MIYLHNCLCISSHFKMNYASMTLISYCFVIIQDRVPAFSPEKAKEFIKKELGVPVDILYKEFEDQPIAAASLGQVFGLFIFSFMSLK